MMKEIKMPIVNFDEEAKFIVEHTGCTLEEATSFVEQEDCFMDLLGLNIYENNPIPNNLKSDTVVDETMLNQYIVEHSDYLTLDKCEMLQKAELEYFIKLGLVETFSNVS